MKINYYSNEKNEYLSRELGWIWKNLTELNTSSLGEQKETINILCVGQNPKELERISKFPNRSIWVLLYADETLSPKINISVVKHHAVHGVIRHYPCTKNTIFHRLKALVGSLLKSNLKLKEVFSLSLLASVCSTFVLSRRMHSTYKLHKSFSKVSIHLYLGYTNLFVKSFANLMLKTKRIKVEENDSLLQVARSSLTNHKREIFFSFTGQQGKFWRAKAIHEFQRWGTENIDIPTKIGIRNSFGGTEGANGVNETVGLRYVEELLASRYVLCPSGNYSIYTFRFLESIASGALPLHCYPSPSDPISGYQNLHSSIPLFNGWSETLSQSVKWTESQRRELLEELFNGYFLNFQAVNTQLKSN